MNFCSACGAPLQLSTPPGDDRPRHVCPACNTVHYQNPRIITGTLPVYRDRVLLCKRAIEPRRGYWTLPAGFLEMGESLAEGAIRETWEEARAEVDIEGLYAVYDIVSIGQVYVFFRAALRRPQWKPGAESAEVRLFAAAQVPWKRLAFPVVHVVLSQYWTDRERGEFPLHNQRIEESHWSLVQP